jgi:hypothetical protein
MDSVRVKRSQFATFLNTTPNGDTATYVWVKELLLHQSLIIQP